MCDKLNINNKKKAKKKFRRIWLSGEFVLLHTPPILMIVLVVNVCLIPKHFLTNPHEFFFRSSTLSFSNFFPTAFTSLFRFIVHKFFSVFFQLVCRYQNCRCMSMSTEMRVSVFYQVFFWVFGAPTFNAHPYVQLNVFIRNCTTASKVNLKKIVHRLWRDSVLAWCCC